MRKQSGAIRSSLRTVAKAAVAIEIAMDIAILNLNTTLAEEQHEANQILADLAAEAQASTIPTEGQ